MSQADICLILEGSYPYVSGGVAQWAHDLIRNHSDLSFILVSILPPDEELVLKYKLPENVIDLQNIWLQDLPKGESDLFEEDAAKLFPNLERVILNLQVDGNALSWVQQAEEVIAPYREKLGETLLLNSFYAWNMLVRMYHSTMHDTSFLNFYWSWRCLLGSFYSVMLADIPKAQIYHSLCTGYAGLFMSRAGITTKKPCLLTEHGIYTNERRIEVTASQCYSDMNAMDMAVDHPDFVKSLKDFWVDMFAGFSKASYESADKIITLYEGNREVQILEGADPEKVVTIANGIDYEYYSKIPRDLDHPPTIALIGRVVPIKDVKSFIFATKILKKLIPNLRSLILGGHEEDPEYYKECNELVSYHKLEDVITFTGRVNVADYLPEIDLIILTSISEGQPLSILEGGAAGIPCITTDVGSCSEVIYGKSDEDPPLGPGGMICPLSNPEAIAREAYHFIKNKDFHAECSATIQNRVKTYYHQDKQIQAYKELYDEYLGVKV